MESEDLGEGILEIGEIFEDVVGLGAPLVRALLQELPLGRFEPLESPAFEVGGCEQHLLEFLVELVRMELEVGAKLGDEPLQLLPLGSIEARQSSNLGSPSAAVRRPGVAIVLYIVQALLEVLERYELRLQCSVALVQVVDCVIEPSSLLYSDLFLVIQVGRGRE